MLDGAGDAIIALLQTTLYDFFGPENLNILLDLNDDTVISVDDVVITIDSDSIQYNLRIGDLYEVTVPIEFDLGLPAIGLDIDVNPTVTLDWQWDFGFGFSVSEGFYVDTSDENEIEVVLSVTIPDSSIQGRLFFLQLDVSDDPNNPSIVSGTFLIDLKDPLDSAGTDRFSVSDMLTGPSPSTWVEASFSGDAFVNLNLIVSFGGDANFPRVLADFNLAWNFANASTSGGSSFGGKPDIAFNNVGLDLGSFFSDFVGPVLREIQKVTEPLQPIVDVITAPIPIISDLAGSPTSLLDLAQLFGVKQAAFVQALADLITLINSIPTDGDSIIIEFGSFNLGGTDVRGMNDLGSVQPNMTSSMPDVTSQLNTKGASSKSKSFVNNLNQGWVPVPLAYKSFLGLQALDGSGCCSVPIRHAQTGTRFYLPTAIPHHRSARGYPCVEV